MFSQRRVEMFVIDRVDVNGREFVQHSLNKGQIDTVDSRQSNRFTKRSIAASDGAGLSSELMLNQGIRIQRLYRTKINSLSLDK
jgi:hypothetical protein